MLGVNVVHAIDHSDYEGADIIVEDQYRSEAEWLRYRLSLTRMNASRRPNIRLLQPTPAQVAGYGIRNIRGLDYLGVLDASSSHPLQPMSEKTIVDSAMIDSIRVIEATYGWNQRAAVLPRTANVPVRRGNITDVLAMLINGRDDCDIEIDL